MDVSITMCDTCTPPKCCFTVQDVQQQSVTVLCHSECDSALPLLKHHYKSTADARLLTACEDSGLRFLFYNTAKLQMLYDVPLQSWLNQMGEAVQPFIPDHAHRFAQYLAAFLASKLSIVAHDRLVFGEAPEPTQVQMQPVRGTTKVCAN